MGAELRECSNYELGLWLLRRRRRFKVTGLSMLPLLLPGQEVLVHPRAYRRSSPQVGDIVVAQHPHRAGLRLIKRVAFVQADGACFLLGDNAAESTDSRSFGAIAPDLILGRVEGLFP